MRKMIKVAAIVAVIGAVAVVALAGSALASGGNNGYSQGMMGNHGGSGMMNGHDSNTNGAQAASSGQGSGHSCQEYCPMQANGVASSNATDPVSYGQPGNYGSAPATQNHCWGRC